MKVDLPQAGFLTGHLPGSPQKRLPEGPVDAFRPTASTTTGGSLSRDQVAWLTHGLILRSESTNAEDLRAELGRHGLSQNWESVRQAYSLAEKAHQGQVRDDGTPYIHHCARTLRNLVEKFGITDPSALTAALLHDVLEDTKISGADIEKGFGAQTRSYVELLSKPPRLPGESYDQRNGRYVARLEDYGKPEAVALKLADRLDNIDDVHLMPDRDKVRRYLEDTRGHYLPLAQRHFPQVAAELAEKMERASKWLASSGPGTA